MRTALMRVLAAFTILLTPATALAQGRTPAPESGAVGGEIGVFIPSDDALGSGLALEGFYEYYLTSRLSVRTGLGWANPSFDRDDDDALRHFRVALDVVHNWEGGTVHPFVGGGIGIYFLQPRDDGESVGDSESKIGATLFGGFEYFTSNTVSVKGELRYHIITNAFGVNPDGVVLTIGLKKYF